MGQKSYILGLIGQTHRKGCKMIKIICYGKEYIYKSQQEAFNYFMDCYRACDPQSSEASRYSTIIMKIADGETNITDEEY